MDELVDNYSTNHRRATIPAPPSNLSTALRQIRYAAPPITNCGSVFYDDGGSPGAGILRRRRPALRVSIVNANRLTNQTTL